MDYLQEPTTHNEPTGDVMWDRVFNTLHEPVAVFDKTGKPVLVNRAAFEAAGEAPRELDIPGYLAFLSRVQLQHRDGRPLSLEELPSRRALNGEHVREVYVGVGAEGRRLFEVSAVPLQTNGSIDGAVLIWHDITAREESEQRYRRLCEEREAEAEEVRRLNCALRHSEERLRQRVEHIERVTRELGEANRVKDEFLATLSHELRTPLNAILGWSHLLIEEKLPADASRRALDAIARNARTERALIEDLLDVSHIVTGQLKIQLQPVRLPDLLDTTIESVRPAADAKGIAIDARCDSRWTSVLGDRLRLQQVFWNLLSNAVKFTPEGGHIDVSVESTGAAAEIRVADTGSGIAPEFLPHVFERFGQPDSSPARPHTGLGLGLAIVRHLVELHGGTVSAGSDGEGRGAVFTVTLPLRTSESTRGPVLAQQAAGMRP